MINDRMILHDEMYSFQQLEFRSTSPAHYCQTCSSYLNRTDCWITYLSRFVLTCRTAWQVVVDMGKQQVDSDTATGMASKILDGLARLLSYLESNRDTVQDLSVDVVGTLVDKCSQLSAVLRALSGSEVAMHISTKEMLEKKVNDLSEFLSQRPWGSPEDLDFGSLLSNLFKVDADKPSIRATLDASMMNKLKGAIIEGWGLLSMLNTSQTTFKSRQLSYVLSQVHVMPIARRTACTMLP